MVECQQIFPFMLYQHKFMLHQHNKFMMDQDLSAVQLFPSPHAVRSYHHLQWPVVLQDLKLLGLKIRYGVFFVNHTNDVTIYIKIGM